MSKKNEAVLPRSMQCQQEQQHRWSSSTVWWWSRTRTPAALTFRGVVRSTVSTMMTTSVQEPPDGNRQDGKVNHAQWKEKGREESFRTLALGKLAWDAWNCKILLACIHCKKRITIVTGQAVGAKNETPFSLSYPMSYCRQHASLKSVTGDSSAWIGCPLNHLLLSDWTAFSASSSWRNYKKNVHQL